MFGIDSSELAVVVILALIFIGPKDLPKVMRTVGYWVGRVRGMARHFASRHHRRVQRDPVLEAVMDTAWEAPSPPPEDERRALIRCMEELSEKYRRMIVSRYQDGLNSRQIGEMLDLSADAVRMALARARQAVMRCLQQRMEAP